MMYQLAIALMMLHNSNIINNRISNSISSHSIINSIDNSTIRGKQGCHRTWKQQVAVRAAAATVSVMTVTMVLQLKRSWKGCNRCAVTVPQVILLLVSTLILAVVAAVSVYTTHCNNMYRFPYCFLYVLLCESIDLPLAAAAVAVVAVVLVVIC
jgi:hypothetical protein